MSQVVHNLGITYGNNNSYCGNTTNSYNQCNISIPDEKRQILEWISPFASRERHQAVRDSRVEKVGDWLLCNQDFSIWRTSEDRMAKPVLFCYGHPGAGKTYISSLVIDTLLNAIDGDSVAVAYVYCDFTIRNMQSTSAVLGLVLRQVVGALEKIPDELQGVFEKAKRQADGCGLRLPEILDMLTKVLPSLNRAFICIDALDEFPTKQRAQLWKSLQRVVRGCPNTRLFLTGRPQIKTEVEDYFPGEADMVTIEPTEEDIRRYIEERLEGDLDKSTIDEELQADIRSIIPKRVEGIFLLVCLGMDEILAATTIHQKRQALDRMANGLGVQDAYSTTLDRIERQDRGKSKLGMAVLMWVSRCERPLQWKELSHALGVDLAAEEFTIDNVPSIRTVLGCTLGLVTIDKYGSTVRLLHLTLQEYLGASPTIFETPQSMMAEICLTYLNSPAVRAPQRNLDTALEESPFLEYATHFWGTHAARNVTEEVKSRALRLLDGYESHVSATILWQEKIRRYRFDDDVYGISGLHCIAFLGIAEIAIAMLEKKKWDVNGRDSMGDTPLMWAVRYGNRIVVELLVECPDIDPNCSDGDGLTPLSYAAKWGREDLVNRFLERMGINPDVLDRNGRTPLSFAALGGHKGGVKLLLGHRDVNPYLSDISGRTPLSYAASSGCKSVVKLLLACEEVGPSSCDHSGRTPLSFAALEGHEGVVKLLLGREDVNPNHSDRSGCTPLSCAAISGAVGVVGVLLDSGGVNPNSTDSSGRTPLSFAALGGHESVVEMLLGRMDSNTDSSDSYGLTPPPHAAAPEDKGAMKLLRERGNVNPDLPSAGIRTPLAFTAISGDGGVLNCWGNDGRTVLLFAAWIGDEALVGLLLERRDVNPDFPDSNLRTPLSLAASGGHEGVVKLLLKRKEVNPNSSDNYGQTPLYLAASGGHESVVRLLLSREDVNPNSPDHNGQIPLSLAASRGHEGVVKLLLQLMDVNLNSPDRNGQTPLSLAASGGHEAVVRLLLKRRDVAPGSRDNSGRTPLSFAASRGREGIVGLLLKCEYVNPDSSDRSGRTPLSFAAMGGHEGVVKLLLEHHKVNPDSLDSSGRAPLSFAAEGGHEGTVKLLLERKEVNPDSRDSDSQTPLSFATLGEHEGVVKLLLERSNVNLNSSDNDGQTPLLYATTLGLEGEVKVSDSRRSNCQSLENPNRMPTSITVGIVSHQGVMHPLTPTDDVTLATPNYSPLDAPLSGFAPSELPQKQPLPFQPSPPSQLHSRVATPIPTPAPGFLLSSPAASILSSGSTSGATPDPAPSKPPGALKLCLRAIQKPFHRSKRKDRSSSLHH